MHHLVDNFVLCTINQNLIKKNGFDIEMLNINCLLFFIFKI